jgi:Fe-S cluster biogenesis protein NfuA
MDTHEEFGSMTPREKIEEILDSIRPAIRADGGDVELCDYREDDGVVEVRLLGACESCPISMMTLKEGIERRLKNSIPGIVEVTAV